MSGKVAAGQRFGNETDERPAASRAFLRRLRLWTGLTLFLYATMHLLNQAFGIRSIEAMEMASRVLFQPWQSLPGRVLLYGGLAVHAALGLRALYRRRHLRLPAVDAVQLAFGLAIPAVLFAHAGAIAYLKGVYGARIDFDKTVYALWVASPEVGLPRQFLLIIVVWIHGCIGVRAWLRGKSWYPRSVPILMSLATLLPVLAVLGFINAGLDMRDIAAQGAEALRPGLHDLPGSPAAAAAAEANAIANRFTMGYLALLAGIFILRMARDWHATRFDSVRITYPGGRVVSVPVGFSVLEASRWSAIPHASVCGGRGRCSTCRVEITAGGETLPAPAGDEQRLLRRIGAPPPVRLACQIRPERDIAVVPLVHSTTAAQLPKGRFGPVTAARREAEVAALFVDLRQSTRLADDRLPYDTFFIVERYIKAVSSAVRASGGHVTNIAGDGVMSVFGTDGPTHDAARDAFRAALRLWEGIDALNEELRQELNEPLRIGIGLHVGVAVVGTEWTGGLEGMPFLGDTGNVAARLEAQTKQLGATLIASKEAVLMAAGEPHAFTFVPVMLAGKQDPIEVLCFRDSEVLRQLVGAAVSG
ncbi:adenylate/guanylate cyclase domain-containing protein [Shinella yambaruensis]|uniref:Adenylate/guanylate cyclase domain-containing protein n=1 Tax=Shinella yambaruensis TaxID=415996 RepID=A0ABQ5ZD35_9HYPH|nr:adenylate/guanylate cyclase domain-containing protein [Shinella yambaruensis]MCJ8024356.1 adenylate/guanylate cyclase domain-containing protein [Shinella yambaruensis]MCU7980798.1 adenylate/guanylate cyclase domain-containing protein [Shinella yambaruensis]GLR49654.1 adenylate/guanylate cyclase domain-containing protein [Shinella yambaruensis]